jgi:hypothetical protein
MEGISLLVVIIGSLVGVSVYELLLWLVSYFLRDIGKQKVDQEFKDYLQHINSKSVSEETLKNKKG